MKYIFAPETGLCIMVVEEIIENLLIWWESNKRDFPWRHSTDPYKILIAEKLLQQTAVGDRVVRAYGQIIENYPTLIDLANADELVLSGIIKELGLLYRAKELVAITKFINTEFQGEIPQSRKLLLSIPGIGEYITRAILSFGYNLDFAVVDTSVSRFLYRYFGLSGDRPKNPARNKLLIELAQSLLPTGKSKEFNLAILDLCAKVCVITKPLCAQCPLHDHCSTGIVNLSLGEKVESDFTSKK